MLKKFYTGAIRIKYLIAFFVLIGITGCSLGFQSRESLETLFQEQSQKQQELEQNLTTLKAENDILNRSLNDFISEELAYRKHLTGNNNIIFETQSILVDNQVELTGALGSMKDRMTTIVDEQMGLSGSIGTMKDQVDEITHSSAPVNLTSLYKQSEKSVFYLRNYDLSTKSFTSSGSGFVISASGIAVTSAHVIKDLPVGKVRENSKESRKTAMAIFSNGGRFYIEEVFLKSFAKDYALVRLGKYDKETNKMFIPENIPFLPISSTDIEVGGAVYAIGNPKGGLNFTFSQGIISGLSDRLKPNIYFPAQFSNVNMIQTTTPIAFGSSGGPLLNIKGEVIGIIDSGIDEGILSFAVDVQDLKLNLWLSFLEKLDDF